MPLVTLPLVGSTTAKDETSKQNIAISQSRLLNLYPERDEQRQRLIGTPGSEIWATLAGNGGNRGLLQFRDDLMCIKGRILYKVSPGGSSVSVGILSTSAERVPMATSGFAVGLVDDNKLWKYDDTGLSQILDPDLPGQVSYVTFMDGWWLVVEKDTGRLYQAENTYDMTNWNALDFATAEARPDNLIAALSKDNFLWLFGERSLEIYLNTGNIDFSFEPVRPAVQTYGIEARDSLAVVGDTICWLGQDSNTGGRMVYAIQEDPVKISDHRLDDYLQSLEYDEIKAAYGYGVAWKGHPWYVLTFPTENIRGRTFVYDLQIQEWFEWATYSTGLNKLGRFRGSNHIYFNGEHVIADYTTGDLYKLKDSLFTDGGELIIRERAMGPFLRADGKKYTSFEEIFVDMETGAGTPGTDYTISLSMSRNAGKTWDNARTLSLGKGGETDKQMYWHRNGRAHIGAIRLRTTAECPIVIRGGHVQVS